MGEGISQRFLPFSTHTEASPPFFRFFSLFEKHGGYKTGKLKLKRPEQLGKMMNLAGRSSAMKRQGPG